MTNLDISSSELACTIRTLGGDMIVAEPQVGRWYVSVDNRLGKHVLGAAARYLGDGDFLSSKDEYFDDACSVNAGWYLLLLRHQDTLD